MLMHQAEVKKAATSVPKMEHAVGTGPPVRSPILQQLLQEGLQPPPQQPQGVGDLADTLHRGVAATNIAMAYASNEQASFNDSLQTSFHTVRTTMSEAVRSNITTTYGENALGNTKLGLPPPPPLAMLRPPLVSGHQWPLLPQGQGVGVFAVALRTKVAATNTAMANALNAQAIFSDILQTGFQRVRNAMCEATQSTITTMNCGNALANAMLGLPPPPPLAMPGFPLVPGPQLQMLPQGQGVRVLAVALRTGVPATNTAMANASNAQAIFNDSLQTGFQSARTAMSEAIQSTITTMNLSNSLANAMLGLPPPPPLAMPGPPPDPGPRSSGHCFPLPLC